MTMIFIWSIFIVMILIKQGSMAVQINCEFKIVSSLMFDDIYSCVTRDFNVLTDNEIVDENEMYHHLSGMTNIDVKALIIEHQKVISIPDGIGRIFPKLEIIQIMQSELKQIPSDAFVNMFELKILDLSENSIEELDYSNIFKDNSKLEIISFKSNGIKTIARNIFNNLESLKSVSFKDNDCIDDEWTENFDEMRKILEESCSSTTIVDEDETIIFTTMRTEMFEDNDDEKFSVTCNFVEKFWKYSEKDFFTCSITEPIQNSNYFLPSHNINKGEKVEAFEISAKESKFLPKNLNILSNLIELNVEHTQLESISGKLFIELKSLKRMSFSGNEISAIEKNTFLGLDELIELNLSEGEIRFIVDGAFSGLKSLLLLNLGGNKLNYLASSIFDELTQLQHISLELNHLTYLSEDLFHRNSQLINIWLNGNKISSLSSASLSYLSKLRLVDLQKNECIDKLFNETNIDTMSIELDENCDSEIEITKIVKRVKNKKKKKTIKISEIEDESEDEFEIDDGQQSSISDFTQDVTIVIPPVESLDVSSMLTNLILATGENNLKIVMCQFTEILFSNVANHKLKTCVISDQIIDSRDFIIAKSIDENFDDIQGLILMSNENVKFLPQNISNIFPNLLIVWAENSSIGFLPDDTFQGLKKLQYLSLANNNLKAIIPGTFDDNKELKELDLSDNIMENVEEDLFEKLTKLKVLRLNDNKIHYIHPRLLKPLRSLENLSINNNYLTTIDDGTFKGNIKTLSKILLSNNKLKTLSSKVFKSLKQLEFVDLSENKCIDEIFNKTQLNAMYEQITKKCGGEYRVTKKILSEILKSEKIIECSRFEQVFWHELNQNLLTCVIDNVTLITGDDFEININSNIIDGSKVQALAMFENKNIEYLPAKLGKVFPNLRIINATNNNIQTIGEEKFKDLNLLKILKLSGNKIKKISSKAFVDLEMLEGLEIDNNEIDEVDEMTFVILKKLKKLALSKNNMKTFDMKIIEEMEDLEEVSIDNLDIEKGKEKLEKLEFEKNPNLKHVKINGKSHDRNLIPFSTFNELECEIITYENENSTCKLSSNTEIDNETYTMRKVAENLKIKRFLIEKNENVKFLPNNLYNTFPHLEEISVTQSGLSHVDGMALKELQNLKILDLSRNNIRQIPSEMFNDLEKLEVLNFSSNKIEYIDGNSFDYLKSLNKLFLSDNKIHFIDKNLFTKLRNLNEVKLDGNLLSVVEMKTFQNNPELNRIDLSRNYLHGIESGAFIHLKKLYTINLLGNKCIDDEFVDIKEEMLSAIEKKCELEKNTRKIILNCVFDGRICRIDREIDRDNISDVIAFRSNEVDIDPKLIEHLMFDGNRVKALPRGIGKSLLMLEKFSILNTQVNEIDPEIFMGMENLKELTFSGNKFSNISMENFNKNSDWMKNLKILNLSNNEIDSIDKNSFGQMEKLEKLILSNNKIRSIHENLFKKLRNLKELKLDGNFLSIIEMKTFQNNQLLSEIDLSKNFLETLSPRIFDKLENISRIKLKGNKCIDKDFNNENGILSEFLQLLQHQCSKNSIEKFEQYCSNIDNEIKSCTIEQEVITEQIENPLEIESLTFQGKKLESLPSNLGEKFPNLKEILIRNQSINTLSKESFKNLPKLKKLKLEGLNHLTKNLFDHLENLESLEIEGDFDEIETTTFNKLIKLNKLKIVSNKIKILDPTTLIGFNELTEFELQSDPNIEFPTQQIINTNPRLQKLIVNGKNLYNSENPKNFVKCYFEHFYWSNVQNPLITCTINSQYAWDINTEIEASPYDNYTRGLRIENNQAVKFVPKNIAKSFPILERLSLTNLSIESITNNDFQGLNRLESMNLSNNLIAFIQPETFMDLKTLKELDLSNNKINFIDEKYFEKLPELTKLNLGNNKIMSIIPSTFSNLPKLKEVFIEGNNIPEENILEVYQYNPQLLKNKKPFIPQESHQIDAIKEIGCIYGDNEWAILNYNLFTCKIVSAIDDVNIKLINHPKNQRVEGLSITNNEKVKFLPSRIGDFLPNLIVISASNNSIESISHENFKNQPALKFLNLARNRISNIDAHVFLGLKNLQDLDLSDNHIVELDESTFKNLPSLNSIYLGSNFISNIPANIFEHLVDLKNVSLENNRVQAVDRKLFARNLKLKNIWLNRNEIKFIDPRAFENLKADYIDLRENDCINKFFYENDLLNLKDNILHFCQNNIIKRTQHHINTKTTRGKSIISTFHPSSNKNMMIKKINCKIEEAKDTLVICSLHEQVIDDQNVEISASEYDPYIQIINFDNNKNLHVLPRNIGKKFSNLRVLKAKNTSLSSLNSEIFENMENLNFLDLSENKIEKVPSKAFEKLTNLEELHLTSNRIQQIEPNTFSSSLSKLHLDNNKLKSIDSLTFNDAKYLQKLHLQNNELNEIPQGAFSNNRYLEEINLAGNKLKSFDPNAFENLLNLQLVDLEGNDCISGTFKKNSFKSLKMKIKSSCMETSLAANNLMKYPHENTDNYHVPPLKVHPSETVDENILKESARYTLPCEHSETFSSTLDDFTLTCSITDPVYGSDAKVESAPRNHRVKRLALTNKDSHFLPVDLSSELPELEELSAPNLEIESISSENFRNLKMLKNVILPGNNLKRIEAETFSNLPSLETLDLSNNRLKYFQDQTIYSLKDLNLQGNELRILTSESMENFPSLEYLNLNNNKLFQIDADTFLNNPMLKRIILSNNEISKVDPNAFSNIEELDKLDLNGNECINESFERFSLAHLKKTLEQNCGSCGNVRKLLNVCRRNLNAIRKLGKLTLDTRNEDDKLRRLENDLKRSQAKIEMLNKHIQKLKSDFQQEKVLNKQYENQLNVISNQNQNLQERLTSCSGEKTSLSRLQESLKINCKFSFTKNGEYSCDVVDFVSLVDNSTLDDVEGNHKKGKRNSDIVSLTITEQNVKYLPKGVRRLLPNLTKVKIENSNLRKIGVGNFQGDDIVEIIITGNYISFIEQGSFDDVEMLKFLDLSNNMIQEIPSKLFMNQQKLISLNIDDNVLRSLSGDVFPILNMIQSFSISNNKLKEIDPSIMKRLKNSLQIDFTRNECVNSKIDDGSNIEKIRMMSEILLNCTEEEDEKFCKL